MTTPLTAASVTPHAGSRALLQWAVALAPFEDSALQATPLRFFGASPSALFIFAAVVWSALADLSSNGPPTVLKRPPGVILFFIATSALSSTAIALSGGGLDIYAKLVKFWVLIGAFAYLVIAVSKDLDAFKVPVLIAAFIAAAGYLVGDVLGALPAAAHFTENMNSRPRGLSLESSTFGTQIGVYALLAGAILRGRVLGPVVCLMLVMILVASISKGAIVSICFGVLLCLALRLRGWWVWPMLALALMVIGGYLLDSAVVDALDLENGTSLATRATMFLLSIKVALLTVIGASPGGAIYAVQTFGQSVIDYLEGAVPLPLLFSEVQAYVDNDPDAIVTYKTFFADNLAMFGVPFAFVYLTRYSFRSYRLARFGANPYIAVLAVFMWLAITWYHSGYGYYSVATGLGFILAHAKETHPLGHT